MVRPSYHQLQFLFRASAFPLGFRGWNGRNSATAQAVSDLLTSTHLGLDSLVSSLGINLEETPCVKSRNHVQGISQSEVSLGTQSCQGRGFGRVQTICSQPGRMCPGLWILLSSPASTREKGSRMHFKSCLRMRQDAEGPP